MTHEEIVKSKSVIMEDPYQENHEVLFAEDVIEILDTYRAQVLEEAMPFLKAYKQTLDCDWSLNPVQAVQAVYRSPESVLRESADAIERKREQSQKLNQLIERLEHPTN